MRIVLDTTILVRATEKTHGPARDLLLIIVSGKHTLVLSSEILHEVAKVLRYPRLQEFYGLSEARVLSTGVNRRQCFPPPKSRKQGRHYGNSLDETAYPIGQSAS